jgi:hypothetical protein
VCHQARARLTRSRVSSQFNGSQVTRHQVYRYSEAEPSRVVQVVHYTRKIYLRGSTSTRHIMVLEQSSPRERRHVPPVHVSHDDAALVQRNGND